MHVRREGYCEVRKGMVPEHMELEDVEFSRGTCDTDSDEVVTVRWEVLHGIDAYDTVYLDLFS